MTNKVRDSILLAALTTLATAISSWLAFFDVSRAFLGPSVATIACSFPLSLAILKPGVLLSDVIKTIIGCLVGWALGASLYAFSSLFASQLGSTSVLATLLTFPFVFALSLSDPLCKSPAAPFIQPSVAIITMYVISAFARTTAYSVGLYMLISYSMASLVTLCVFLSVRPVVTTGSAAFAIKESLTDFQDSLTHWFEGLTAFMLAAAGEHENELDERQRRATAALADVQDAIREASGEDPFGVLKDKDAASNLSGTIVVMHSQLLALRGTIFSSGYADGSVKCILGPVRDSLDKLRMTTVLALCPRTPDSTRKDAIDRLSNEALCVYNDFARSISLSDRSGLAGSGIAREEIRLVFAVTSIVRFALLTHHLITSVDASLELHSPMASVGKYLSTIAADFVSLRAWRRVTDYRYAFRAALAQQVMAQLLLVLAKAYPTRVTSYIFWAMVPVVSTFLETVGAGLIVGSKNIIGCMGGAALGVLAVVANPGNREAIYLEMLVVAFCAKFVASSWDSLRIASFTFASTWNVLMIPNVHIEELRVLLSLVGFRISLTALGVFASAFLSIVLFPSFAAQILRKSAARTVTTAARLVTEGITGVVNRQPVKATDSFDEERSVCCTSFSPVVSVAVFESAGFKALHAIRTHASSIPAACTDAAPELFLLERFVDDVVGTESLASLIGSEPLFQRLSDAACVFSSIAAATRVQENCHDAVFSKQFVASLFRLTDVLAGAAAGTAATIMDPKAQAVGPTNKLTISILEITNALFATRESLEKSGLLGSADRGGWLLIYVFHFALVEFAAAWDELAGHIGKRRRCSAVSLLSAGLEESFMDLSVTEESAGKTRAVELHKIDQKDRIVSIGWN